MTRKSVIGICAALLVTGIGIFSAETASAGWGPGNGYRANSYGNSAYGHQNYGNQTRRGYAQSGYSNWGGGYGGGHSDYHNTTHFNYQPPTINRHGNHFDSNPGHYDLHRSGHYDRH